jgi:hypothetical protein
VIKELHLTSDEDVELWVIRAVSSKLIEAKMDQSRKVVLVMYVHFFYQTVNMTI